MGNYCDAFNDWNKSNQEGLQCTDFCKVIQEKQVG